MNSQESKIGLFGFIFSEAFRNISRRKLLHMVIVLGLGAALIIPSIFVLVSHNVILRVKSLSGEMGVVVFIKNEAQTIEIDKVRKTAAVILGEDTTVFVSKDDALEQILPEDQRKESLNILGENPLMDSLEIRFPENFPNRKQIDNLLEVLESSPATDEVIYDQEWLDNIFNIIKTVELISIVLGAFVIFSTLVIIVSLISLSLNNYRQELEVMHILGASRSTMRGPFIIKGLIHGTLSSTFAIIMLFVLYKIIQVRFFEFSFLPPAYTWGIVLVGILLGFSGSALSLRTWLKKNNL
jgi:cell division transport system permease protein